MQGPPLNTARYTEADRVIEAVRADVYWQWKDLRTLFRAAEVDHRLPKHDFIRIMCQKCSVCSKQRAGVLAEAFLIPAQGVRGPASVNYGMFIQKVIALFGKD